MQIFQILKAVEAQTNIIKRRISFAITSTTANIWSNYRKSRIDQILDNSIELGSMLGLRAAIDPKNSPIFFSFSITQYITESRNFQAVVGRIFI